MKTKKSRIIYLIRHAEPARISPEKTYLGQLNPPLSTNGCKQAACLAQNLRKRKLDAIYCSDLLRAKQTADTIARYHNCSPISCKELREINLGQWDGLPFSVVKAKYPDLYAARGKDMLHFRPPGGESFADLQERVIPAFNDLLRSTTGNLAIIAHAGVNRVILSQLQQLDLTQLFSIKQKYAQLYMIRQSSAGFYARAWK